ncbi:MAG TPA: hypothetical protein VN796_02870, partial [Acidimicrobiales bacterium]|nr:hypothetical protein [Acidimicrobiales bacterium]
AVSGPVPGRPTGRTGTTRAGGTLPGHRAEPPPETELDQGIWTAVSCQSPVTRTGSHRPSVAKITGTPDGQAAMFSAGTGVVDDWELA